MLTVMALSFYCFINYYYITYLILFSGEIYGWKVFKNGNAYWK